MNFLVIPAVDLKNRKCVQLRQGRADDIILELDDPVEVALNWESRGAQRLHIIDLDGAIKGRRVNEDILQDIVKSSGVPVQFGGGIRSIEDARKILDLGVDKIILGTIAINNPQVVSDLADVYGKDRIIIALDSKDGKVLVKGWKEKTNLEAKKIVKSYEETASEVLFTNVNVEGLMKGFDGKIIEDLVQSTTLGVIVSGGITTIDDVKKAKSTGAIGCVVGSALYTGKLDFKTALKAGEQNVKNGREK
ncbi:MAG: 1-(5-phosphoribosyl)-5-[(5-phosphoribosylamino)methylideneamino]imidazole-4-carboxamide isomerase [Candidatus Hydrothermarchaeales archaeon]